MMKSASLFALILLVSGLATSAMARGTLAGKTISNQTSVAYSDANGKSLPRCYSNIVTLIVAQVAGISIDPANANRSGANRADVSFRVVIHNAGNASDTFDFVYAHTSGWEPSRIKFYTDTNDNHRYDAGVDALMSPVVNQTYRTGLVTPDADFHLLMVVTVPTSMSVAADQSISTTSITANSVFNPAVASTANFTVKVSTAALSMIRRGPNFFPITLSQYRQRPGDPVKDNRRGAPACALQSEPHQPAGTKPVQLTG